jgi:receptor protein-tyrosine kinase/non-specific protein-tyrosine kinase
MSRIEKAMERASHLRQSTAVLPEAATTPVTTPVSMPVSTPVLRRSVVHTPPSGLEMSGSRVSCDNPLLVTLNDPNSPIAEEYRKLKSLIVNMTNVEDFKNVLMVTSSIPGEGKSITSLNLAISLAQEYDHTVLIIDADLRRPSVHRYLNIERKKGLAECLMGEANLSEAIIPTGIGKLSVVTAGREVSNPAELFSSNRMKELLEEIKHRYPDRYIIFDTPPLLPFAETMSLANLVDGVVFVVKEQLATQANIKDALEALKECSLLGIVYNDANTAQNLERYYSYRDYSAQIP